MEKTRWRFTDLGFLLIGNDNKDVTQAHLFQRTLPYNIHFEEKVAKDAYQTNNKPWCGGIMQRHRHTHQVWLQPFREVGLPGKPPSMKLTKQHLVSTVSFFLTFLEKINWPQNKEKLGLRLLKWVKYIGYVSGFICSIYWLLPHL